MKLNDLCYMENSLSCQSHRVSYAFHKLALNISMAWMDGMMKLAERFRIT